MINILTNDELKVLQALPLEIKIEKTKNRIREWVYHWGGDVCVSFSGGKDSTVLLDIARSMFPDLLAVFVDTGLEYPEIREFVKTFDNVEWLKPKKTFKQVIDEYGYPFISKEVSENVYYARMYVKNITNRERERERESSSRILGNGRYIRGGSENKQEESRLSIAEDRGYP